MGFIFLIKKKKKKEPFKYPKASYWNVIILK